MVTRKPVGSGNTSTHKPPYPTSPVVQQQANYDAFSPRSRTSSVSSHDTWNSGFSEDEEGRESAMPAALNIGGRGNANNQSGQQLPTSLRPGAPSPSHQQTTGNPSPSHQQTTGSQAEQVNPWASDTVPPPPGPSLQQAQPAQPAQQPQQLQQASLQSHNSYLRVQNTGQTNYGADSQAAWGETSETYQPPPPPSAAPPAPPVELPTVRTPTDEMAGMTLDGQLSSKTSAYNLPQGLQPASLPQKTGASDISATERQHSGASSNPWDDMDREDQKGKDSVYSPPPVEHSQPPPASQTPFVPQSYQTYHPQEAHQAHQAYQPPEPHQPQEPYQPQESHQSSQTQDPWQSQESHQPSQMQDSWQSQHTQQVDQKEETSRPQHVQGSNELEEPWQAPTSYQPPQSHQSSQAPDSSQHLQPWQSQQPLATSHQQQTPLISLMDTESGTHEDDESPPPIPRRSQDRPPPWPPRPSQDIAPPKPPRPTPIDVSAAVETRVSGTTPETPMTRAKRQRNETYQVKLINWFDASAGSAGKMRRSPIMTQNANGPCPLLALVNALTLSTPDHVHTALVDALRSREQVSLGLLLDAVFEELARRSEITDKELPDVADLYSFLITLHTGMNVNPRFVAPGAAHVGSVEAEVSLDNTLAKPGVFEETREMILYSTFDIPLIHGWTPLPTSPAYAAFDRSARTFDEALNIQFREQELEDKLDSSGLSSQEQQTFEDIHVIKDFLETYPTQLTHDGLEVMSRSLDPGQIAILFRNDHFSTLYKNPRSGALMTLVTDAGYSSHEEIVWESLVDVTGAANDLFSGDFRPVGNSSTGLQHATDGGADGWETMPTEDTTNAGSNQGRLYAPPPGPPPGHSARANTSAPRDIPSGTSAQRSASEQEDHDLALALQLQEEEEDQHRRDAAARRRQEDELSRQFLDRESSVDPTSSSDHPRNRPQIPPRRSNLSAVAPARENAPSPGVDAPYVRGAESSEDMPPPYEQAASDRPFRPAGSQPRMGVSNRQGDPLGALNAIEAEQRRQGMNSGLASGSPYAANSLSSMSVGTQGTGPAAGMGYRRRSGGLGNVTAVGANGRMRRSQSQSVPGHFPGATSSGAGVHGNNAAPGNQQSEQERCVVM